MRGLLILSAAILCALTLLLLWIDRRLARREAREFAQCRPSHVIRHPSEPGDQG
jgi:ABC-type Fe3+ transport system permease subunit